MKKLLDSKNGITLIALVITIIVILILAGISITIMMGQDGIIKKTKEGSQNYQNAAIEEQKVLNSLFENIINGSTQTDKKENDNSNGGEAEDDTRPTIAEVSTIADAKRLNAKPVLTGSTILKDDNDVEINVPLGFNISQDSATVVANGIVIEDKNGNEFVWIPVSRSAFLNNKLLYSRSSFNADDYSKYTETMSTDEQNSVELNNGFYIGRYEAGDSTIPTASTSSLRTETSGFTNAVCIKKGYAPYNYITKANAQNLAENFDTVQGYTGITGTKLCSSYAWDSAITYIQKSVSGYATNSPQGNYSDVENFTYTTINGTVETKEKNNNVLIPTGQTTPVCGIYDLGGNVGEWSTETYTDGTYTPNVIRGGNYINSYSNCASGHRAHWDNTILPTIGFRIALFL